MIYQIMGLFMISKETYTYYKIIDVSEQIFLEEEGGWSNFSHLKSSKFLRGYKQELDSEGGSQGFMGGDKSRSMFRMT